MSVTERVEEIAPTADRLYRRTVEQLSRSLVDLEDVISQVVIAIIADGHALLEGVPGTAKTTLCRNLATALGLQHRRIQFTPDLLPSDVTGTKVFDPAKAEFVLKTGPVFCQCLLADELNRAPARTQAALLEAMQERQVTIEGDTLPLPEPFVVLATQNPVEQEGVYRLPEAQLDRFLFRVRVGYPDRQREVGLLELQEEPTAIVETVASADEILRVRQHVDQVFATREIKEYIVDVIRASRDHPDVLLGASPRAAIFLLRGSRAAALLGGQAYLTHENVQAMAHAVLEHRIIVRPEAELSGRTAAEIVEEVIQSVPVREA